MTQPDGVWISASYDDGNRMTALGDSQPAGLVSFYYDNLGRRYQRNSGSVTHYGFDTIGRLASLQEMMTGGTGNLTTGFGYNPASQAVIRTRDNDAYAFGYVAADRPYVSNGLNQYSSVSGTTYTYDANGNLSSDGINSYTYDAENRLVASSLSGGTSLTYDPLGRLWQTYSPSHGTSQFVHDGDKLSVEYDGAGAVRRRYAWGPGVDEPLVWYEGAGLSTTNARLLKQDHQGSVISMVNWSGVQLSVNRYDEYGVPASGNQGRFQYTGQAWLPDLGMYYYKARIYSPMLGRFLQTDPIGYDDDNNLYAYVGNDPVNKRDPSGTSCEVTKDGKTAKCKVDEPNGLKGRALARVNSVYTNSVNRLLRSPNSSVKISAVNGLGKTVQQNVKAGDVAKSLIQAKVLYGGASTSYTDGGKTYSNLASTTGSVDSPSGVQIKIYEQLVSKTDGQIGNTLTHEGIHTTRAGNALRDAAGSFGFLRPFTGAPSFNVSHQSSFNAAAAALQDED